MVGGTAGGERMTSYLDRIGAGKILVDPAPLTYDYVPDELVGRDEALAGLAGIFQSIDDHKVSCRAAITGKVGSGKTVLSHRFSEDLCRHLAGRRNLMPVHVNCRNHPSKAQVLQRIVTALDERHPERGFGSGEILHSVRKQLHAGNRHMLLVLDEVDVLLRADKGDLLYQLLRIDEGREDFGTISVIIISQEQVLDWVEEAILSRFGASNHIRLEEYNAEQLAAIAAQRAELACHDGSVPDSVLRTIGQRAEEAGDARQAIELLEDAVRKAEMAGRAKVTSDDVRFAGRGIGKAVEPSVVDNLNRHAKLILLALCRRLRKEDEITSGDAEKLYHVVCEEYEERPRSHTTFWKNLKELEVQQLIEARISHRAQGRGRTQYLTIPAGLPGTLEKRVEASLSSDKR